MRMHMGNACHEDVDEDLEWLWSSMLHHRETLCCLISQQTCSRHSLQADTDSAFAEIVILEQFAE